MSSAKRHTEEESLPKKRRRTECEDTITDKISFNRFENNLMEEILSYLSLEDKVKLSSLNKRIQSLIFNKQTDLVINSYNGNEFNSISKLIIEDESGDGGDGLDEVLNKVNTEALNNLLNRLVNVTKINATNCLFDSLLIDSICDNCKNLKVLILGNNGFDEQLMAKLGQFCGNNLVELLINPLMVSDSEVYYTIKPLLRFCTNLITINCDPIESITDTDKSVLPKLQNIVTAIDDQGFESYKQLIDKYKDQLKTLEISLNLKSGNDLFDAMELIQKMTELEKLSISITDPTFDHKSLDNSLKQIAMNCKKLNSFTIDLEACNHLLITDEIFDGIFSIFNGLKYFRAHLPESGPEVSSDVPNIKGSISCFKNCSSLISFSLIYHSLDDKFIENICEIMPNLTFLHLGTATQLTDNAMTSISKLSKLKFVKIERHGYDNDIFAKIKDTGISQLINFCKTIREVVFNGIPNITIESIKEFVKLAENNPKQHYLFSANMISLEESIGSGEVIKPIDMDLITEIPDNLILNVNFDDESFDADMDEDDFDDCLEDDLDFTDSEGGSLDNDPDE